MAIHLNAEVYGFTEMLFRELDCFFRPAVKDEYPAFPVSGARGHLEL